MTLIQGQGEWSVELVTYEFLFVPHSNYVSAYHRLVVIDIRRFFHTVTYILTLDIWFQCHPRSKVKVDLDYLGLVSY